MKLALFLLCSILMLELTLGWNCRVSKDNVQVTYDGNREVVATFKVRDAFYVYNFLANRHVAELSSTSTELISVSQKTNRKYSTLFGWAANDDYVCNEFQKVGAAERSRLLKNTAAANPHDIDVGSSKWSCSYKGDPTSAHCYPAEGANIHTLTDQASVDPFHSINKNIGSKLSDEKIGKARHLLVLYKKFKQSRHGDFSVVCRLIESSRCRALCNALKTEPELAEAVNKAAGIQTGSKGAANERQNYLRDC